MPFKARSDVRNIFAQIMLTHGQSDGKPGLSIDDVVYSYYGNRSNSKLENKLNGSMKDKAPVKERLPESVYQRDKLK
jgi:hypothetical protein